MPVVNSLFEAAAKIRVDLSFFLGRGRFLRSPLFRSVFRKAWVEGRAS
jgi:hypothetical protein